MEESWTKRGNHLIGKLFLLRVFENSSCRTFELWKKHNMEKIGFFSRNMNSLRVMENSSYRRWSYRSSTVYIDSGAVRITLIRPVRVQQGTAAKNICRLGPVRHWCRGSATVTASRRALGPAQGTGGSFRGGKVAGA
jgi:hypothetical protein